MIKKLISLALIMFMLVATFSPVNAQMDVLMDFEDTLCTTSECDVFLRQYFGLYVGWRLTTRCIEGNKWGPRKIYYGQGLYSGTLCFDVKPY